MGKCIICKRETYKVLFRNAVEKIYICSEECLKEYFKPAPSFRLMIQRKFGEHEGWLD